MPFSLHEAFLFVGLDGCSGGFSFLVGKESEMKFKSKQKELPVEGRDRENGGRCFESSWNEMVLLCWVV